MALGEGTSLATGAREGETTGVLDLTDERQRERFITLVPHTIAAKGADGIRSLLLRKRHRIGDRVEAAR
ncbi:hypothetical protein ACF09Z_34675 [Streptomyces erythrochromogenes]|uniref:hypothetical protein n=1 Tax=Streptomyces erythrochromogenes TaxID=285574 RepID=UPI0036FB7040